MERRDAHIEKYTQRPGPKECLLFAVAVLYASFLSLDAIDAWQRSPFDRFGGLAMLVWFTPLLLRVRIWHFRPHSVAAGVAFGTLGTLSSLNVLQHIGLCMVLFSVVPNLRIRYFWIICAVCWMPAFGWLASRVFPDHAVPARMSLAVLGALTLSFARSPRTKPLVVNV